MRPEIKFRFATEFLFRLLFIAGETEFNFVSGVVEVKRPIRKY